MSPSPQPHALGMSRLLVALVVALGLALSALALSPSAGPFSSVAVAAAADDADDHGGDDDEDRLGAVFAETNAPTGNRVLTYRRSADGRLNRTGAFDTGGRGSGAFEQVANSLILGSSRQSSPADLGGRPRLLFVTNTMSNSITVFRVRRDRLERVEIEPSNGTFPTSLTLHHGVLYVLNGGGGGCTGGQPNITGFRVSEAGQLTPISDSTRAVSGGAISGCAHVIFDRTGTILSVTQRQSDVIDTFRVGEDDRPSQGTANQTTGSGPFGATITRRNQLLTAENFAGAQTLGALASYRFREDATVAPIGPSVRNLRSDSCWIELTDDNRFGFVTNAMSGDISSYRLRPDGSTQLLRSVAATIGLIGADEATVGSRFLYARSGAPAGSIHVFRISPQGDLVRLQDIVDPDLPPFGAIGLAAL